MQTLEVIKLAAARLRELDDIESAVLDDDGVAVYTLADAIRSGSRGSEQATRRWTTPDGRMCALSAALADVQSRNG